MKRVAVCLLALSPWLVRCGGGATGNDGGQGQDSGSAQDSGMGGCQGCVPDPGTSDAVDQNWGDTEPNDTPAQATPLGTALNGSIAAWVNGNTIGGSDSTDYFVFRSASTSGTLSFDFCFSAPITAMSGTLWTVVGGTPQLPPVGTWTSTGTCLTNMTATTPLQANTVYLMELTATGGAGTYGA